MQPEGRPMVRCICGFHCEREDVVEWADQGETYNRCDRCKRCEAQPDLREAYRRGYNAGIDALWRSAQDTIDKSNLKMRATQ